MKTLGQNFRSENPMIVIGASIGPRKGGFALFTATCSNGMSISPDLSSNNDTARNALPVVDLKAASDLKPSHFFTSTI
ncbi:MAG: hypothetical protein MRK01_00970 [Candidatus Scalindua sp.]|nr:hypothetical protein [Candidatus Scalindua sp.]